jgi:hypothetical protein
MVDTKNVVEIEYVTTSEKDSLSQARVEEETLTTTQGEVGYSSQTQYGITNPNPETPDKLDEMKGQQQGH